MAKFKSIKHFGNWFVGKNEDEIWCMATNVINADIIRDALNLCGEPPANPAVALLEKCFWRLDREEDSKLSLEVREFLSQPCPTGQPTSNGTAVAQIADIINWVESNQEEYTCSDLLNKTIDKLRQFLPSNKQ